MGAFNKTQQNEEGNKDKHQEFAHRVNITIILRLVGIMKDAPLSEVCGVSERIETLLAEKYGIAHIIAPGAAQL